jgi:hypothetical protein
MLNSDKLYSIKAPEALIFKAKAIWNYYKSLPSEQSIDIEKVIDFLMIFKAMLQHTGKLRDQYEYDRRLISSVDISKLETTSHLAERTIKWLKEQPSFDVGRAADILHNFYYCMQLQCFSPDVKLVLSKADMLCDDVLRQYKISLD